MTKCMFGKHCAHDAKWQIGIVLWSSATPHKQRRPQNGLHMLMSVVVCDDCKSKIRVEHFLLPEGRARIAAGLHKAGRAPADFMSARLELHQIIDKPVDPLQVVKDAERRGERVWET